MIDSRAIDEVPNLIADLYRIVDRLERLFHGRPFTVDGHLLGSIGEVLAAYHYGLDLTAPSTKGCDAQSAWFGGIEIKTTQRKSVAFRSEPPHLLVFQLDRTGRADEVFNGPGKLVWPFVGSQQKNGQSSITLSKLRELQRIVPPTERLPRVRRPGSDGAAVKQHCPVCSVAVEPNARYPLYVCQHCASRATSADGQKLEFYNLSLSGGFGARYMDTGTEYGSHECFIRPAEAQPRRAHPARAGFWDSIPEEFSELPLSEEERAELERRLAEHEQDPSSALSHEEVRARLQVRFGA